MMMAQNIINENLADKTIDFIKISVKRSETTIHFYKLTTF